jgi:hypothetical protein
MLQAQGRVRVFLRKTSFRERVKGREASEMVVLGLAPEGWVEVPEEAQAGQELWVDLVGKGAVDPVPEEPKASAWNRDSV